MTATRREEIGHQALASFLSKSRTTLSSRPDSVEEKRRTCDDASALDGPYSEHAHGRLDGEQEEGHGEMSSGDDVL